MLALTHMEIQTRELPNYTIRISERARRISLRFSPESGLELIIPSARHERKALEFLKSQQSWIEKKQAQYRNSIAVQELSLPHKLFLPALDQHWNIIYPESARADVTVLTEANTVLIYSPMNNRVSSRQLLLSFMKSLAELHLKLRLDELSQLCQLEYNSLRFGSHKTQWGSCSRDARINLNIQLLFLDEDLLDYVLIHELCHTRHFNHSKRFWALVGKFIPDYQKMRVRLRAGKQSVPAWVYGVEDKGC